MNIDFFICTYSSEAVEQNISGGGGISVRSTLEEFLARLNGLGADE